MVKRAGKLVEHTGSHKVLPMSSGAEAVESAIKSVRKLRGEGCRSLPEVLVRLVRRRA